MNTKMFRLLALGLAALAASCASPTSDAPAPAPAPAKDTNFGIFSDSHTAAGSFTTSSDQGGGSVTVSTVSDGSTTPFSGSKVLSVDYQQTSWGGFYFGLAAPVNAAAFSNGQVVFTLDTTALTGLTSLKVKVASGAYPNEVGGEVDLLSLTASATSGTWKTYKIPLKAFGSYGRGLPDLAALTTYLGFWNPMAGSSPANGKLLVDEVYFAPAVDLTAQSLDAAAPSLTLAAGVTSAPVLSLTYNNGAKTAVSSTDATWSTESAAVAEVTSAGVITAIAAGSTKVHATFQGKTADINVAVTAVLAPAGVYSETHTVSGSPSATSNTIQGWGGAAINFDIAANDVTALEGTASLKLTSAGGDWGGVIFQYAAGGFDAHAFSKLVFSINVAGLAAFHDLGIKIETDGNGSAANQIQLKSLTPVSTSGDWATYEIPLTSYSAVTLTKINNLGFWNIQDGSDPAAMLAGSIHLDDIYFAP